MKCGLLVSSGYERGLQPGGRTALSVSLIREGVNPELSGYTTQSTYAKRRYFLIFVRKVANVLDQADHDNDGGSNHAGEEKNGHEMHTE